ncbi:hypothetical protein [Hyphomonas sp.]|uniref:hypothetical protein n=1 Tax=Hyphomonas sp. TaxID=87 RepID=UPI0025C20B24|nr:hypothetical protein [Hyphomonas sp.]
MQESANTAIWISGIGVVIAGTVAIGKAFISVGQLTSRVAQLERDRDAENERREKTQKEVDAMLGVLRSQILLFGETISEAKLYAAKHYVEMEDFRSLTGKLDTIFKNLSKVSQDLALQGALIRSVEAAVNDLKRGR